MKVPPFQHGFICQYEDCLHEFSVSTEHLRLYCNAIRCPVCNRRNDFSLRVSATTSLTPSRMGC